MKSLYESILSADDIADDIASGAEMIPILQKYDWHVKSAEWRGDTLYIEMHDDFRRETIKDLDKVAAELKCSSFAFSSQFIEIIGKGPLRNLNIKSNSSVDIWAYDVSGCTIIAQYINLHTKDDKKAKYTDNKFEIPRYSSWITVYGGYDHYEFKNNTTSAPAQAIRIRGGVGDELNKIIDTWGAVESGSTGWSCTGTKENLNKKANPIKDLGLDEAFPNAQNFEINGRLDASRLYIYSSKLWAPSGGLHQTFKFKTGWNLTWQYKRR